MTGFSADWLALREPYDAEACDAAVRDAALAAIAGLDPVAIVDLACGTGSGLRALAPLAPARQNWRLVDNDLSLLARASALGRPPQVTVVAKPVDLARDLELALEGPLDLIATSALLDLVSAEWLDRLIVEAGARRLPIYAALTYDGRTTIEPGGSFDSEILAGFNRHQHTDKGFGPALGPTAAAQAVERLRHFGYSLAQAPSDWVFGPADREIQDALFAAWAELALLTTTMTADEVARWLAQRRDHLAQGRSRLRIGHVDIFARPIAIR
jgi:SAM-dependent methyltransferase